MATIVTEMKINGVTYIRKDAKQSAFIGKYVMVRTYSAGVHMGTLESMDGKEVILKNSIRIWGWAGAASLSQLSLQGTNKPNDCKFSVTVESILLTEAIEIIPITTEAETNLKAVKTWKN